jgi:hypothetical protein
MTDQTPQVRAIATQLIRHAIKQIDSETACDHIVATLGEDVDVDALAFGSESAVRKARIDISWDGAPAAPPLPPVVQSPIREQLLNALDFSFCQSLGYSTPEGLLAAYEASRTQTVDQAALRDPITQALAVAEGWQFADGSDLYDLPERERMRYRDSTDAVLAVLPATTNHDTDTSTALASVSPHTLAFIANHLDARAVAYIQAGSQTFDEWQTVAAGLRRMADETAATSDVGTEFVQQVDQPDEAGLGAWERDLADETAATETTRGCPPDCPCRAVCIGTLKPAGARQDGAQPDGAE